MAYIGRNPTPGEVVIMDSLEGAFNGVSTTFNLTRTVNGVTSAFYPVSSAHLFVSLGGVIQEPDSTGDTGFRINYNTIIFAVPPPANTSCFIISYGNIFDIANIAEGSITAARLADGAVTPAKLSTGGPSWDSDGDFTASKVISGSIFANPQTIPIGNHLIQENYNARSFGPTITLANGATVTVSSGAVWTIL
jgi:hypothetical protein